MNGVDRSFERSVVSAVIVLAFTIIILHSLTAVLAIIVGDSEPVAVLELATVAALMVAFTAPLWARFESPKWVVLTAVALSFAGGVIILKFVTGSRLAVPALLLVCPMASFSGWFLMRRLPRWMDGTFRKTPVKSVLWILLAVLTVVQLGRLSSWVIDSDNNWHFSTVEPLSEDHLCLPAYVYAADLHRQSVDDIYNPLHYPHLNPDLEEGATRQTVDGLTPGDPYQYPPQFLLVPYLALMATNNFDIIKIIWFVIQVSGFCLVAVWLAQSVGGDRGKSALWLIPAALSSFQFIPNFQYGQFHLFSIVLGVVGLLLFERKRFALGGAALGFAILSKITPGILIVWLLAQRKWKETGWTIAACVVYTLAALLILGVKPFESFFADHIPNLLSGSAFAFGEIWPDIRELMIVSNQSPHTIVTRLGGLGVPGMSTGLGNLVQSIYPLIIVVLAVVSGYRTRRSWPSVLVGLALLNLACFFSRGAPGEYVGVGSIWLLTFATTELSRNVPGRVFLAVCWLFIGLSLGVYLIEGVDLFPTAAILTLVSFAAMLGLNGWIVLQRPQPETEWQS